MANRIDLDAAAEQIAARRAEWRRLGITASETTCASKEKGGRRP